MRERRVCSEDEGGRLGRWWLLRLRDSFSGGSGGGGLIQMVSLGVARPPLRAI
jgi:hypothetical protein